VTTRLEKEKQTFGEARLKRKNPSKAIPFFQKRPKKAQGHKGRKGKKNMLATLRKKGNKTIHRVGKWQKKKKKNRPDGKKVEAPLWGEN